MKTVWQPLIPLRWWVHHDDRVLQQAWGEFTMGVDGKWNQTGKHEWRDIPNNINDPSYWSQTGEEA